jgi:hypothetical protein
MVERRKAPRVRLTWTLQAKVKCYLPARVIDVSSTGVLLEMDHPLPPRTACSIKIACEADEVLLSAIIRRCCVGGHGTNEKGQKIVLYHAGLAFENSDPTSIAKLREHLSLPMAQPRDDRGIETLPQNREVLGQPTPDEDFDITLDVDAEDVS